MGAPVIRTRINKKSNAAVQPGLFKKLGICIGYLCLYMPWFILLEKHVTKYHLIKSSLDQLVPFCEYFVVPYLLWFPFVGLAFAWLMTKEKDQLFYRFCIMMFGGMTIALLIYTVFPNGIRLRPDIDADKNVCTWILANLVYKTDTATNVFPSLHVYTSTIIALTAGRTVIAKKHPVVHRSVVLMAALIIMSTVLVKQHSVMDLGAGFIMAWTMFHMIFYTDNMTVHAGVNYSDRQKRRLV